MLEFSYSCLLSLTCLFSNILERVHPRWMALVGRMLSRGPWLLSRNLCAVGRGGISEILK